MPERDTRGLTPHAISVIQHDWDNRVTIKSLALCWGVDEEVIRHIISLPRR
jgi:hypothetical protein